MGLEEKRAQKEVEEKQVATAAAKIKGIVGVEVPIEVDWASLPTVQNINWLYTSLNSVSSAVEKVAKDEMGKQALKEGLKKVVIRKSASRQTSAAMKDGVLTLEEHFDGGSWTSADGIKAAIEKGL